MTSPDIWSDWLGQHRYGGDPEYKLFVDGRVRLYIDRVVEQAWIEPGQTILDIGCGDGIAGLAGLARASEAGHAIFVDVSAALLESAAERARTLGVVDRCTFLLGGAEALEGVEDNSVDRVVLRSVLAYVPDKAQAFREIARVLRPGGRLSLAEPIFHDEYLASAVLRLRASGEGQTSSDRLFGLLHRWKSAQFPDSAELAQGSPLTNFTERDLVALATEAGFDEVHLEFHVDQLPSPIRSWETFLAVSPHPLAPSLGEIMDRVFSEEERAFFESMLRPAVENGTNTVTDRMAYLSCRNP